MDVMNVEQAKIAEEAGACAVMALGECRISDLYCSIPLRSCSQVQYAWGRDAQWF